MCTLISVVKCTVLKMFVGKQSCIQLFLMSHFQKGNQTFDSLSDVCVDNKCSLSASGVVYTIQA